MHKAHTRIFVKKILKKMLFLDIDHAGIGGMLSPKKLFVSSYNMRGF